MKSRLTADSSPRQFKAISDVIDPIIEWCAAAHGRKAEFLTSLNSLVAPQKIIRTQFDGWLHADPDVRVQPSFGIGLMIHETAKRLGVYKAPKA